MEAAELGNSDRLQALAKELSRGLKLSRWAQASLGVVLHLADVLVPLIVVDVLKKFIPPYARTDGTCGRRRVLGRVHHSAGGETVNTTTPQYGRYTTQ